MKRIKELIPLLLLGLYLSYQAGITMFTHVHYVNGVMIVHSHPSKDKQHTHTTEQYLLIHQLSQAQMLEAVSPQQLCCPEQHYIIIKEKTDTTPKQNVMPRQNQLRAPPSFYS